MLPFCGVYGSKILQEHDSSNSVNSFEMNLQLPDI